ncbi:MAG: response regulator [Aquabacterium sp.]|uniref:response regulator n=1 Tax=Aquabacterium sp. TaxID=1872578 RepID=UPI003BE7DEC5
MSSIGLVEDDALTRNRVVNLIAAEPQWQLAFAVESLQQAYSALAEAPPDVLLVDLGLPDGNGLDLIRYVMQRELPCQTLVISVFGEDDKVFDCIEAGASGYLIKGQGDADLAAHLRDLFAGGSPVSPRIARRLLTAVRQARPTPPEPDPSPPADLTAKEFETLSLLSLGYSYAEVANKLDVSVNTVRFHIKSIYSKLYVSSRFQAVQEASKRGWL